MCICVYTQIHINYLLFNWAYVGVPNIYMACVQHIMYLVECGTCWCIKYLDSVLSTHYVLSGV